VLRGHQPHHAQLAVVELVELLGDADAIEHLQGGGMDGVAAEVAREVGVHLQHPHAHAAPGEQQAQDHARRPSADDDAAGTWRGGCFLSHDACGAARDSKPPLGWGSLADVHHGR
jgi:hypothetical protein